MTTNNDAAAAQLPLASSCKMYIDRTGEGLLRDRHEVEAVLRSDYDQLRTVAAARIAALSAEPTMGQWDDFSSVFPVPFDKFIEAYKAMLGGSVRTEVTPLYDRPAAPSAEPTEEMVLVPREPTEEMIAAAKAHSVEWGRALRPMQPLDEETWRDACVGRYKAMLAASGKKEMP